MPKEISADDVPGLLSRGDSVFLQAATGEPTVLVEALRAAPEASDGVHYVSCLVPGTNLTDPAGFHDNARLTTFFLFGDVARSHAAGKVRFLPLSYSGIYDYMSRYPRFDKALIQVSPPDADGTCSLGTAIDFLPAVLDRVDTVIAEINADMPAPADGLRIPYEKIAYAVPCAHGFAQQPTGEIPAVIEEIGERIAGLIGDGDCLQVGIGKVPAAILARLADRRDLGFHGGMVTDEVVDLVEAGALTGAAKTIDTGRMICGMALGTDKVYRWCGTRPDIGYRPASYTHNVRVISQIDNFVSINSVLEVDLFGQANAEMIDHRQVSGTGGLLDFVRGARMAAGGRSIIALPSTAGRKRIPKIVAKLDDRVVVSCPRSDIDIVVTEHGVARLRDLALDERAEALIALADPEHRPGLAEAWARLRRAGAA